MRSLILAIIPLLGACSQASVMKVETASGEVESASAPVSAPLALEREHLHRLLQLSPTIYSGAQPKGPEAFAALQDLGIRTVISVDGARPDLIGAETHGMNYVQVAIGYDGVSPAEAAAFAKVVTETEGPFFFHCHHGRQRGPAAAAIALRASTGCDAEAGLDVLRAAKTSKDYPGLWRDVAAWVPPGAGQEIPVFPPLPRVAPFTESMAELDRTWDRIKVLRRADWESPDGAESTMRTESALLLEQLQDCAGQLPVEHVQDAELQRGMEEVVAYAEQLQSAAFAADVDLMEESYRDLRASCKDCHADYRNE
ncbi:MAG: cytochrome c [Planctomycetota bacterium]|jgi:protein tyrosine phosphatase (PTP) superfamily phosphohydrolase (DUF442 family)